MVHKSDRPARSSHSWPRETMLHINWFRMNTAGQEKSSVSTHTPGRGRQFAETKTPLNGLTGHGHAHKSIAKTMRLGDARRAASQTPSP